MAARIQCIRLIKRLGIAILALARFSVFVVSTGNMPAIVDFASGALGKPVGDAIRDFSNTSKDIVEGDHALTEVPGLSGDTRCGRAGHLTDMERPGSLDFLREPGRSPGCLRLYTP